MVEGSTKSEFSLRNMKQSHMFMSSNVYNYFSTLTHAVQTDGIVTIDETRYILRIHVYNVKCPHIKYCCCIRYSSYIN